jgi:hypothetical protein
MADILHEVTINAAPAQVYKALTQQTGLQSWWTEHAAAKAEVGSVSTFSFYGGMAVFKLSVDQLQPNNKVYWGVLSSGIMQSRPSTSPTTFTASATLAAVRRLSMIARPA